MQMGPEKLNDHFMALDTICDATQVCHIYICTYVHLYI